ncbi:DapH/DapD/GlmU-related protein [Desulfobacula phenolica]|uniref:Transferase hexapeptide (Six repeat-containing protein) n=1 Tax=Desulfobacula phenolica TaxID=90732 RepID=A0A1H2EQC4_9BACT|nr:DapH/DapD/GlmU-related protein [Desulfobacula phenolica]SDT97326.1 transferase hexapeptide (six repeat-containing protein) [Desulfobacula phenolica]
MRKIKAAPVIIFTFIFSTSLVLAIITTTSLFHFIPLGDFRGITFVAAAVFFLYIYAIFFYRLFLCVIPLREGYFEEGSHEEFGYHVYLLFYLIMFYPLTRSKFIPVPLMRVVYLALGAHLGPNTYSSGTILDPPLTFIGANTIIGQDAVLFSHAIEGRHLSHASIRIGDDVTIGANCVIMSGVSIGDGAVVGSCALVLKDTQIKSGEVWGGVPAHRLRSGIQNEKTIHFQ